MTDARAVTELRPSDSTLAELPARAVQFLRAIATRPPIWQSMYEAGFRAADHAEGWRLLVATGNLRGQLLGRVPPDRCRAAMTEVHEWVTTNFRRYRVAMERLHPEAAELFPDVDPRYKDDSLLVMATLVERLRGRRSRSSSSLLKTLEQRGLPESEVERLGQLVTDAQSLDPATDSDDEEIVDRTQELIALYQWYRDWAESAKSIIKRKDYRLALGIGARREA